jgi:hypothetical protein
MPLEEMRCMAASGQLGYGIPEDAFFRGLEQRPAFLGADMGSIDPGPFCLGSGKMIVAGPSLRHDLELVLRAAHDLHVPLLIGSAGTAGSGPQLKSVVSLIEDILHDEKIVMEGAVIEADVPLKLAHERLLANRVTPFAGAPEIDAEEPLRCSGLVAQMGVEPFQAALEQGAQLIVAGRSCDTSIFAALPLMKGFDPGLVMHMAKLIECTSGCAEPGGRDAALGTLKDGEFVIESMDPNKRCTPSSVAAHALYEQADPFRVGAPGGYLDMTQTTYEAIDDRRTRVFGSQWIAEDGYSVKLEGAKYLGYRCISLCGIVDPRMIAEVENVSSNTRAVVTRVFDGRISQDDYHLSFRMYGHNGVKARPPGIRSEDPSEMMVIIDVVGRDREIAKSVCGVAKQYFLHLPYDGILCTSGNCAIPFSPDVLEIGEAFEFNVYHLMELDDPLEVFPVHRRVFGQVAKVAV